MELWEDFDQHFVLRLVGPNLWQAFNKSTMESVSPRYNSKEAAIYYVQREIKDEMEEQIEGMLGSK